MSTLTDCARFFAEDPAPLVAASFCCPWCLAEVGDTTVEVGSHDSLAHCACPRCDHDWDLALHAGQVMRLSLAPPSTLRVRFAREGGGDLWSAAA